jgi:hypothetical protein
LRIDSQRPQYSVKLVGKRLAFYSILLGHQDEFGAVEGQIARAIGMVVGEGMGLALQAECGQVRKEALRIADASHRMAAPAAQPVYAGHAVDGSASKVALELDPSRCHECHEQPAHIPGVKMPMTPIMNELSAPWQHWHAEPVSFDHTVPAATEKAPMFKLLAGEGSAFRKSAARLEQTIRSAFQQRIATARLRLRRNPANVDEAMSLLRPLFCDEHLTFVTEDGASGLLAGSSVVDDGLGSVYFQIKGTGWPWEWWNDKMLRLTPPGAPDRITMMPTRGQAMVAYEKQALSTRALTTDQVMRVRALGWNEPTM